MVPKSQKEFGQYLKQLRLGVGLTIREVESKAGVSNAYLSLIENGLRKPPHPEILRKLASLYQIPAADLMRKAGYLDEQDQYLAEDARLEMAYQHVISDPEFEFGTRVTGNLSKEAKRFIIELYERTTGRSIL